MGRKLVRAYMQEMGIHAVYPKPNLSKRNFKEAIVPYLLRDKVVSFPNQVWSIDITYIKMAHGHIYLTALIDWYSHKIVGWNFPTRWTHSPSWTRDAPLVGPDLPNLAGNMQAGSYFEFE